MTVEQQIFEKISTIITAQVPEINSVNYEKIRISIQGFEEHELPAVQYYEERSSTEHQRHAEVVTWRVQLELIMKNSEFGIVNQFDLFELRQKIQLAIFERPNLDIPELIHAKLIGHESDLHLLDPYHVNRMTLDFLIRRNLTGLC